MVGLQYFGAKISNNISKREPEGYLYCLNVPIARTGVQKYLGTEVGLDSNDVVDVHRMPEEVFKATAIASFEGMPVTRDHPPEEVDVRNIGAYQRGHVQNVRRGSGGESEFILADLVITHNDLISDILDSKIRDVSCGYEVEYKQADDGKVYQVGIRGNHVAIVDSGRAGERVAIRDKAIPKGTKQDETQGRGIETMSKKGSMFARMFASFARDESVNPQDLVEAADEFFAEKESKEEKKEMFDKRSRDELTGIKPELERKDVAEDEGDDEMLKLVTELAQEVKSLKEMVMTKPVAQDEDEDEDDDIIIPEKKKVEPEETSLDELEEEMLLEGQPEEDEDEEETPDEPLNAGSVTLSPEEIDEEDEDIEGVEGEGDSPDGKTREAVISAINELKPIIAGMPAKDRKRAADAMTRAIRKATGLDSAASKGAKQKLAQMSQRKKVAMDSKKYDEAEIGRSIMKARNPHYKG